MIGRRAGTFLAIALLCVAPGCERSESDGVPRVLRARLETEMKAVLQDLRHAEERARALEDRYLALDELQRNYLSRSIPESYELTMADVTASGYRAEIVHRASGLRCRLATGAGGEGGEGDGIPRCD